MARRPRQPKRHRPPARRRAAAAAVRDGDSAVAARHGVAAETVARWRAEFGLPAAGTVPADELDAVLRKARARGRLRRRAAADTGYLRRADRTSAELAGHWDYDIRRRVARNPDSSLEALHKISEDASYGRSPRTTHRSERLRHPQAPALGTEVTDTLEDLRWYVAANPAASFALLRRLAQSEHADVVAAVAASVNTPAALLRQLAAHPEPRARAAAAANPMTPEPLLDRLIGDPDPSTRAAVLRHPRCGARRVGRLAADPDTYVASAALRHHDCPPETLTAAAAAAEGRYRTRWETITDHPNSPPEALQAVTEQASGMLYWPERRRARRRLRKLRAAA